MASYFDFASGLGTEIVTILVGPKRVAFTVHKNLLVSQSNYFRGALTGSLFKEASEGIIAFEEEEPDSFRILIGWLYQHNVPRIQPYMAKPDFSKYKPKKGRIMREMPVPLSSTANITYNVVLLDDPDPPTDPAAPMRKVHCMHLSGHVPYQDFSPEEIRLADYENAMDHVVDPLRRDAAMVRKVHQADSPKKKPLAPNRQAWLAGRSPRPTGPAVPRRQGVNLPVPFPVKAEDATSSGAGSLDNKHGTPSTPVGDPTHSSSPTSQTQSAAPVPPSIHSQPRFTFRPPQPTPKQEAVPAQPAVTPKNPPSHLSYAAVAAMGQQQKTGRDVSTGPIPQVRDTKRAKNTNQTEHAAEDNMAVTTSHTPEMWASMISAPNTQEEESASPESNETLSVSAESDRDATDWPFKTNPEADTLQTTSWLTWKSSAKDLSFRCREEAFEKNDQYQLSLLRLAIMAEKFCWDRLFNAALDAYLDGEVIMNRRQNPLEHIDLAYSSCYPSSPLRRLFADMVHFEVKTCLTHSRYLNLAQDHEEFLSDLFRRLDYETWIPGKNPFTTVRNPLRVPRCQYHHHSDWQSGCLF